MLQLSLELKPSRSVNKSGTSRLFKIIFLKSQSLNVEEAIKFYIQIFLFTLTMYNSKTNKTPSFVAAILFMISFTKVTDVFIVRSIATIVMFNNNIS